MNLYPHRSFVWSNHSRLYISTFVMVWNLDWKELIKDLIDSFDETCFEYWTRWIIAFRDNWIWFSPSNTERKGFEQISIEVFFFGLITDWWWLFIITLDTNSHQPWWSMSFSISFSVFQLILFAVAFLMLSSTDYNDCLLFVLIPLYIRLCAHIYMYPCCLCHSNFNHNYVHNRNQILRALIRTTCKWTW